MNTIALWRDADPEQREGLAIKQRSWLDELRSTPGWKLLAEAMADELERRRTALELSATDDERNRGIIEALRWCLDAPDNGVEAAFAVTPD